MEPVLVEAGDGGQIGHVDLIDELDAAVDDVADLVEPLHVDCTHRAGVVHIDRARHPTHQPVRMRVLAAEDGVDLDDFLLKIECFQVVRDRHQIGFGWQLVGRIAPVAVHERAELAGLDEFLQPVLDVAEVARRTVGPVRDALRQRRRGLGVGLERRHHIDPVKRVQVIEMHQMVMHLQRELHDVADRVGVLGDVDLQRVFHRAHRGQCMGAGAHAADALGKGPCIARIAPLQNHLQPAPHGARRHRVADHIAFVEVDLDPHVALDPGYRVDHHALAGIVELEALRLVRAHDHLSPACGLLSSPGVLRARASAVTAACAATDAPTTPAAVAPTLSALASMPNCLMSVTRS